MRQSPQRAHNRRQSLQSLRVLIELGSWLSPRTRCENAEINARVAINEATSIDSHPFGTFFLDERLELLAGKFDTVVDYIGVKR